MDVIQNHQIHFRQIGVGSFSELLQRSSCGYALYNSCGQNNTQSSSEMLANQIQSAINYAMHDMTRNDYNPATLETIRQKIDSWQTDINSLRANGNNQAADQAEAQMLQSLSSFQQTLETAHKQTIQVAAAQQEQGQSPATPGDVDQIDAMPMGGGDEETMPPAG